MDLLLHGISVILAPMNFFLIFIGVFVGVVVGAIPGLTGMMAIVLLLPVTFTMHIEPTMCLLIGVYVGGISGGFISAILLGIPGTPSSMATTFDGFPMAQKGDHEKALGLSLLSSFFGSVLSGLVLILLSPQLAKIAMKFTMYEYFSLVLFTFSCVSAFSGETLWKPYLSACVGLIAAMVGIENFFGFPRYTGGFEQLNGGIALVPALIGMFALPQILGDVEANSLEIRDHRKIRIINQLKAITCFKNSIVNLIRSALIGVGIGILPGIGPGLSNILSYTAAKTSSKHPETFGTGEPDGIIGSETANNASMGGALIPLLTLGIPGDGVTMVLMGAFLLHGLQLGPLMFRTEVNLMAVIFGTFMLAALITLVLQLSLMGLYTRMLSVKKHYLIPALLVCCTIGCYALNNRMFDVWTFYVAGLLGLLFQKMKLPVLPAILGLILGPMAEMNLRGGLDIANGDITPFFARPVSLFFIAAAIIFFVAPFIKRKKKARS